MNFTRAIRQASQIEYISDDLVNDYSTTNVTWDNSDINVVIA